MLTVLFIMEMYTHPIIRTFVGEMYKNEKEKMLKMLKMHVLSNKYAL